MVVDSSALIAILLGESEAPALARLILKAPGACISAVSVLETGIVAATLRGTDGVQCVDDLIADAGIEIIPFDAEQAVIARSAFERFGRGRHPARLNFGDCAAYALAASRAEPLLFKGGDFALTDIGRAR